MVACNPDFAMGKEGDLEPSAKTLREPKTARAEMLAKFGGHYSNLLENLSQLETQRRDAVHRFSKSVMQIAADTLEAKASESLEMEKKFYQAAGAYANALILLGDARSFLRVAEERGWNKFNACLWCVRHRSRGHAENCAMVRLKAALSEAPVGASPEGSQSLPPADEAP